MISEKLLVEYLEFKIAQFTSESMKECYGLNSAIKSVIADEKIQLLAEIICDIDHKEFHE